MLDVAASLCAHVANDFNLTSELIVNWSAHLFVAGDTGIVQSKQAEGHFKIQFQHEISRDGKKSFKAPMVRVLGTWYLQAGTHGTLPTFPLATRDP